MSNLSEQVGMVSKTDWKLREGYDVVELKRTTRGYETKVLQFGDRLPFFRRNPGYTVNMNPIEVTFRAEVTCQNGLSYSVKAKPFFRCINSAEVAKQFANGEDPVAILLEQLQQHLREVAHQQSELDKDFCQNTLWQTPLRNHFISVEAIHDIEVLDKSTRFSFWLHVDEVTLKSSNLEGVSRSRFQINTQGTGENTRKRLRIDNTSDTDESTQSRFRINTQDTGESTRKRLRIDNTSDTDESTQKKFDIEKSDSPKTKQMKILSIDSPQGEAEQNPQGIFEKPGLELTNSIGEIYTIYAEVHGRTGNGSEDNVKSLRSKIIEQLKLAAEAYEGVIDEAWIEKTILAIPRLDDFQSVIDSVNIPRPVQTIYHQIELQLGSDNKPLQVDIGDGRLLEIEAKIGYITQHKEDFNKEKVITRITEQLQMAVVKKTTFSEEDFREFISNLDLEKDFGLKFQEILYINPSQFGYRTQTRDISFEVLVRSQDGYICSVKAEVNCRVIDEKATDEDAFKSHLIRELKKKIRETEGIPEGNFCEQVIKRSREEIGGFVVENVYVELDDVTQTITIELGKEEEVFLLKTSTGHTYDLIRAEVYCLGLNDDNETRKQIRAYLESTVVGEVQKIKGSLTPKDVHEIIESVGYIEKLNVTVNTATLPELDVYSVPHTVPFEIKLKLPNGKSYIAEGNIYGNKLDEENFDEDSLVEILQRHLETQAENSELGELTSEVCKKWITEFPRFEELLFSLDSPVIKVNDTTEILPIELASEDNPIEIPAANRKTYLLYGNIECTVYDLDTADIEDFRKAVLDEITKYVEKFSDADKDPDDSRCEEIAKQVGDNKKSLGITINQSTIHLRSSVELMEAKKQEEFNRTEIETAVQTLIDRLEKLRERDLVFYEHFIDVIKNRLQGNVEELKDMRKERKELRSKLMDKTITRQEYDEFIEVLDELEDKLIQNLGKVQFTVPSEEIIEIQQKYLPSVSKRILECSKEARAALNQEEQATQEDNMDQIANDEESKEDGAGTERGKSLEVRRISTSV